MSWRASGAKSCLSSPHDRRAVVQRSYSLMSSVAMQVDDYCGILLSVCTTHDELRRGRQTSDVVLRQVRTRMHSHVLVVAFLSPRSRCSVTPLQGDIDMHRRTAREEGPGHHHTLADRATSGMPLARFSAVSLFVCLSVCLLVCLFALLVR
jgi:hypothetical protein